MSREFVRRTLLASWVVLVSATCQAQILPPMSAGPPVLTPFPPLALHISIPQGPNGEFQLGDPVNPLVVSYSPAAGPLEKWLMPTFDQNGDGQVDPGDFFQFISNPILLQEHLIVGPGQPWTDWHERIVGSDWVWTSVQIATPGTPPGPTGLVVQNSGTAVNFYFDPIVPGTPVDINKRLQFVGMPTPTMIADFVDGKFMIRVVEYPTSVPEPGSGAILLVATLVTFVMHRHRSSRAFSLRRIPNLARNWSSVARVGIVTSSIGLTVSIGADAAQLYSLTDLGSLVGPGGDSTAWAINNAGFVAGYSETAATTHAFRWDPNTNSMTDLGDLPGGGDYSAAWGISPQGDVVGVGTVQFTNNQGFRWTASSGVMSGLGGVASVARGINATGFAVGRADIGSNTRPVRWAPNGTVTILGDLPGGAVYGEAQGINASGFIVGNSSASGGIRAFRWDPNTGMMTNMGALASGGSNPRSEANAINDSGFVAGESNTSTGQPRAVRWDPNNNIQNLGTLGGGLSVGDDINSQGDVVGWSTDGIVPGFRAMLWTAAGGMIDLNDHLDTSGAGWTLTSARGINDAGWIVGYGRAPGGPPFVTHGYLLRPLCMLGNSDFGLNDPYFGGGHPTTYGDWNGDQATQINGPSQGIAPRSGQSMLRFDSTGPNIGSLASTASEVWQLVDVTPWAAALAAGKNVVADFEYFVNRVAGDGQTDTQFSAWISAHSGSTSNFVASLASPLGLSVTPLLSDANTATWERVKTSLVIPNGTNYLAVRVAAGENIFNDASNEFDGHFADDACLQIRVVPEPTAIVLLLMAAGLGTCMGRAPRC